MKSLFLNLFTLGLCAQNYAPFELYEQTRRLLGTCQEIISTSTYSDEEQRRSARRIITANMQLLGLERTIFALAKEIKSSDLTFDQREALALKLVHNNCSPNITTMSWKLIQKKLLNPTPPSASSSQNVYKLPAGQDRTAFDERTLSNTIENFKDFCSWSPFQEHAGRIAPYLKDPTIFLALKAAILDEEAFTPVVCDGYICRPQQSRSDIAENLPKLLGHQSLDSDLERLFCQDLQMVSSKLPEGLASSKISSNIRVSSFGQLLTRLPSLLNLLAGSQLPVAILEQSLNSSWDKWAREELQKKSTTLYFEESLNIDLVKSIQTSKGMEIGLGYTLGEYDRMLGSLDKIGFSFDLMLDLDYLKWLRTSIRFYLLKADEAALKGLKTDLNQRIRLQFSQNRRFFLTELWNEELTNLISEQIIDVYVESSRFPKVGKDVQIKIKFSFGLFALKYVRNKFKRLIN